MARNVLAWTLIGIGVFIGEVSQYSSYTKEVHYRYWRQSAKFLKLSFWARIFQLWQCFKGVQKFEEQTKNVHVTMVNCLLRSCVLLPFNKERKKIEERKVRIIRYVGDQGQISSFVWSISGLQRLYKDQLTTNSTINPSLGCSPGGLHKTKNKISI